eukprot:CAMPEP_0172694398 /NCGR_PEP_ID=MMETSP1074-20121228/26642_1 /TAXON_ID=2916 /ORGANISM="Ceratium fusus, Strain PA161109" /LENGTH=393 /DNA_ID=CAMNT_0013514897 /DNA_START=365 /DNA_END=1546 /DNA_ORIENTATION=+
MENDDSIKLQVGGHRTDAKEQLQQESGNPVVGVGFVWSDKFRGWHYYNGQYDGFVVPPSPVDPATGKKIADGQATTCSIALEATPESKLKGSYRMFYTIFDGSGYRTALATSDDLLAWDFSPGVVFDRSEAAGLFDYGGVTFGCPLYGNASITGPRTMKKVNGKYWMAYGAYPLRGLEQGSGADGIAWSLDGDIWERESTSVPFMSVEGAAAWESSVIYQPNLVLHDGNVYDFYNAKGSTGNEQSGLATISLSDFPGVDTSAGVSQWQRNPASPLIRNGPKGSVDTQMASDPKVWYDDELGCWVMFYFGLGDGSGGHADIMAARSSDLITWEKDPEPIYKAGGHPAGIDDRHAHKVSLIYKDGVGYLYYTAIGKKGNGIALLTSQPLGSAMLV